MMMKFYFYMENMESWKPNIHTKDFLPQKILTSGGTIKIYSHIF